MIATNSRLAPLAIAVLALAVLILSGCAPEEEPANPAAGFPSWPDVAPVPRTAVGEPGTPGQETRAAPEPLVGEAATEAAAIVGETPEPAVPVPATPENMRSAVLQGDAEQVVEFLTRDPSLIAAEDGSGWTLLHLATLRGDGTVAEVLLDRGTEPDTTGINGATPLFFAALFGNAEVAEVLLAHGAKPGAAQVALPDGGAVTALHLAATYGYPRLVRLLVDAGLDVDVVEAGKTALQMAAQGARREVVEELIRQGADVNRVFDGLTPLHWAAWRVDLPSQEQMAEAAAQPEASGDSSLLLLQQLRTQTPESFHEIIDSLTDVFVERLSPGSDADRAAVAGLLVENGAEIEAVDGAGFTPLHMAAEWDHVEVVEALLAHDAEVNPLSLGGRTPLFSAIDAGNVKVVRTLLSHDADLQASLPDGRTPLHIAAQQGSTDVVSELLQAGADVNMRARQGQSPLHYAAFHGNRGAADVLLENGADVGAIESLGSGTPALSAGQGRQVELAVYLLGWELRRSGQEERLQAIVRGEGTAENLGDAIRAALLAYGQSLFATSAALFEAGMELGREQIEGGGPRVVMAQVAFPHGTDPAAALASARSAEEAWRGSDLGSAEVVDQIGGIAMPDRDLSAREWLKYKPFLREFAQNGAVGEVSAPREDANVIWVLKILEKEGGGLNLYPRYLAGAAARAGCGQGEDVADLDEAARADLRLKAIGWLREDVAFLEQQIARTGVEPWRIELERILEDPDLACVQGEDSLAGLPDDEAENWRQLWAEIGDLLGR